MPRFFQRFCFKMSWKMPWDWYQDGYFVIICDNLSGFMETEAENKHRVYVSSDATLGET